MTLSWSSCSVFILILFEMLLASNFTSAPGSLTLPFTVHSGSGSGTGALGSFTITDNFAKMTIRGREMIGVVYIFQDWASANEFLYDIILYDQNGNNLALVYLYCDRGAAPHKVTTYWIEDYTHPFTTTHATGSMDFASNSITIKVNLPNITLPKSLDTGINVIGANSLSITAHKPDSSWIVINGYKSVLIPFNTIDCTNCGQGGWYELHSMFTLSPNTQCFGILYFMFKSRNSVLMDYGICNNPPSLPKNQKFEGQWSGTLKTQPGEMIPPRPLPKFISEFITEDN